MKKLVYILFLLVIFSGCEEKIEPYSGQCGIYFENTSIGTDTMTVQWGLYAGDVQEQTLALRVNLFGDVADYDRKFSIRVEEYEDPLTGAREGIDYVKFPLEYTLSARQAYVEIPIDLKRTEALQTTSKRFKVVLEPTPELQFLYSRFASVDSVTTRMVDIQRVIVMNEDLPKPWWWYNMTEVLGKWSMKKGITICDVMGIDREIWLGDLVGNFTEGYLRFVGKYMYRWLQENPTMDGDDWMTKGPASQN